MTDPEFQICETREGLTVRLHVLPRAKHSEITGLHNGALKIKITAPPVDDAANRAIVEFFSRILNTPRSNLKILAGSKSREKVLQIKGLSRTDFKSRMPGNLE